MFDRFRYKGTIQVLVDATGLSSHDYNLNCNCTSKTKNGVTKYYKYVLESKIVFGRLLLVLIVNGLKIQNLIMKMINKIVRLRLLKEWQKDLRKTTLK